jgi:endonuclease III
MMTHSDESLARNIAIVDSRLKEIYGTPHRRDRASDPVGQLIGTILSQATTDVQTARSYENLRCRFPTWEQVRDAPASAIAKEIRASGLSDQKAPRIKAALQHITRARGRIELNFLKDMPAQEAKKWLMQIAGVGPKTASIVLLFTFQKRLFPVDTHIHRIAGRLGWAPQNASAEKTHEILEPLIPDRIHYRLHINLIRLGREICIARTPCCEICPLTDLCDYYQGIHADEVKLAKRGKSKRRL